MKTLIFAFLALFSGAVLAGELPYSDPYTSDDQPNRRATRGEWIIEGETAKCTQDDALYKKYKDHGPVIWYNLDFTDGTVKYTMKVDEAVQGFIFTINGKDGHVFRFVSRPNATLIKCWPREGDTEQTGVLDKAGPSLSPGTWIPVEVAFKGDMAIVKIGDYVKEVKHPAISQAKTTIGLGFSYGTLELKDFVVAP